MDFFLEIREEEFLYGIWRVSPFFLVNFPCEEMEIISCIQFSKREEKANFDWSCNIPKLSGNNFANYF